MHRTHLWIFAICVAAVSCCCGEMMAVAAGPPSDIVDPAASDFTDKNTDRKPRPELSETELATTLEFAAEHHPELARLLQHLRKSRPHEFQRAARELNHQIQFLQKLREKNSSRYLYQLEIWKTDSQIRVLVAKWSRTKEESLELEIRELLQQRRETKLAQLKAEHLRLTGQLQKVEKQIASFEEPTNSGIDREWEQLAKKTNTNLRNNGTKISN